MRFIEKALVTTLLAHGGLSALVGTRIYNTVAPQGVTFPCVLFQKMGGFHIADNPKENMQVVYAVKGLSDVLADAEDVDFQIKEALDRQTIDVNTDGMADYYVFCGIDLAVLEDVGAGVIAYPDGALFDIGVAAVQ